MSLSPAWCPLYSKQQAMDSKWDAVSKRLFPKPEVTKNGAHFQGWAISLWAVRQRGPNNNTGNCQCSWLSTRTRQHDHGWGHHILYYRTLRNQAGSGLDLCPCWVHRANRCCGNQGRSFISSLPPLWSRVCVCVWWSTPRTMSFKTQDTAADRTEGGVEVGETVFGYAMATAAWNSGDQLQTGLPRCQMRRKGSLSEDG